jgi:NADP-dependent 3-hydroxy acid dehydrogenase YdfG
VKAADMEMDATAERDLQGRAALITGASGGIGRAIAVRLSACGMRLCVVGRDRVRVDETVRAVRRAAPIADTPTVGVTADLVEPGQIRKLAADVARDLGELDSLVHAAGVYRRGGLEETSLEVFDELYQTNVRVPYAVTQAVLASLARRTGDVVFINSTQGLSAAGGIGGYAATQHAMKAVSESLRAEVNRRGVRVTTIHLGRTATPLQEGVFAAEGRAYTPELLLQPDDVAEVVVSALRLPKRAQIASLTLLPTEDVAGDRRARRPARTAGGPETPLLEAAL